MHQDVAGPVTRQAQGGGQGPDLALPPGVAAGDGRGCSGRRIGALQRRRGRRRRRAAGGQRGRPRRRAARGWGRARAQGGGRRARGRAGGCGGRRSQRGALRSISGGDGFRCRGRGGGGQVARRDGDGARWVLHPWGGLGGAAAGAAAGGGHRGRARGGADGRKIEECWLGRARALPPSRRRAERKGSLDSLCATRAHPAGPPRHTATAEHIHTKHTTHTHIHTPWPTPTRPSTAGPAGRRDRAFNTPKGGSLCVFHRVAAGAPRFSLSLSKCAPTPRPHRLP